MQIHHFGIKQYPFSWHTVVDTNTKNAKNYCVCVVIEQDCIPVGCVPPAAMTVSPSMLCIHGGGGVSAPGGRGMGVSAPGGVCILEIAE